MLTNIVNRIFQKQEIPDDLKLGIITPVPKKQKNLQNPDHYRRITVNSMIGKFVEMETVKYLHADLLTTQSRHQFGFTEGVSCNMAAVLITEAIGEAKDCKSTLINTFMDASKAFDVVYHNGLMCTINSQGVTGRIWHFYNSAYTNIKSHVK